MAAAVAVAEGPACARLTIRPLAQAPRPPADYEERSWEQLREAVRAVFEQRPLPGGSQEEVYRLAEAVCASGFAEGLARRLQAECEDHVARVLAALVPLAAAGAGGEPLLRSLRKAWQDHCSALRMLCGLFLYLDRTYLSSSRCREASAGGSPRSLWDCGLELFRWHFVSLTEVCGAVIPAMLDLLDGERRAAVGSSEVPAAEADQEAPAQLLGSLVAMLSQLGLYELYLEPQLIQRTRHFYQMESGEWLRQSAVDAAKYLAHCEQRLQQESARCTSLLEARTEPELLACVREELLAKHRDQVLNSGFALLVKERSLEDLARAHRLFAAIDQLGAVKKAWSLAIKGLGSKIMAPREEEETEEEKGIVPALIELRALLGEILAHSFQGSQEFGIALKDAFEEFLNAGSANRPAKLLARHTDEVLRSECSVGDDQLEDRIDRIVGIFRLVVAKDAFEAFYKKDLAKRLLLHRSASSDAEALMVQKLCNECGSSFTSQLEGMFRDIELSKGFSETFVAKPNIKERLESGLELDLAVLTSGLWPTQPPSPDMSYPLEPAYLQEQFAQFYTSQHGGRSLRWCPLLGQCVLRATFQAGVKKELVVSHFQAVVLLLFNATDSLTCEQIGQATRIPTADLHRTLQSLALHKTVKLLLKESKGRQVQDAEVFAFNKGFSHKLYHITVSQISAKEQREEEAGVEQRVFEDRQHEIDAAVVRIMKAKKRLSHQQLITEVFSAARFPAEAADVKKRIEALIEREYMERDPEQAAFYNYLA